MNRFKMLFYGPDDGSEPSLGGFDDDDAEMTEIITLGPGEEPPSGDEGDGDDESGDEGDKVTLSREEYEALRSGKDPTEALTRGLAELKDVLGGQNAPANVQQKPGESDEDFEKRLEQELFSEGKSGKAIKEAIQRYGGPQMGQMLNYISQQNKKLLELDGEKGPVFKRYKSEIEKEVEKLPQEQQTHPQVWDYAFEQVKNRHKDELEQESAQEMANRLFREKMEALGLDENGQPLEGEGKKSGSAQRRPAHVESGKGSASRSASGGKKTKRLYEKPGDRERAAQSGVDLETYLKRRARGVVK